MNRKWMALVAMAAVLTVGAAAVAAQDSGAQVGEARVAQVETRFLWDTFAHVSGLLPREVVAAMRSGQTLNELAAEYDVDMSVVLDRAVTDATSFINRQVAAGTITGDTAANLIANLQTDFTVAADQTMTERRLAGRPLGDLLALAAEQTGLEPADIIAQVQAGQSIADILEANGATVEGFSAAVIEQATTRLNEAVSSGRLTQEQADARLERLTQMLETRLGAASTGI